MTTLPSDQLPDPKIERRELIKSRIVSYNEGIISGKLVANRWLYAAAKRFETDLTRSDIYFDWNEAVDLSDHFDRLTLIGEWSGKPFTLHDWQLYAVCNIICWKLADGRKRFKLSILQVARGAGKSTLMAGLCLYDMMTGQGKRVHVIANNQDQAEIILDTARVMVQRLDANGDMFNRRFASIDRDDIDSSMTALPALERSLDGLNPSTWIADEAAEFKGRFLTKLLTTGAKRRESTGVIISTPGSNSENHFAEIVKNCEAILSGEVEDDSTNALLFGLDKEDKIDDETTWVKANPGLAYGQPDLISIRRSWNTMKQSPMGRSEFCRYHCSRMDENMGGWLEMDNWSAMVDKTITEDFLSKRVCYGGLDLSKSGDMTAFVLAFPLEDGRVFMKGRYWFPKDGLAERELSYRMPCRTWAAEGKLELSPGREIDYGQIRQAVKEAQMQYDLRIVCYDAWGSKYLAENLIADGVPLQTYRMSIGTFAPGCQLWVNHWNGKKICFPDDPIMRRACAEAHAKRDINGNIRPVKGREFGIIDPLVAGIMALHSFGGKSASIYDTESELFNG